MRISGLLHAALAPFVAIALSGIAAGQTLEATASTPPRGPVLYIVAGQSNLENLAMPAPVCGTAPQQANVWYQGLLGARGGRGSLLLTPPIHYAATLPVVELGQRLGQHHPNDQVEIAFLARSGSSLLMRNASAFGPREAWVDPDVPGNPLALINRLAPAMLELALKRPSELHIIWGQGESDCMPMLPRPANAEEYAKEAQDLFAQMARMVGVAEYHVHLVTIGAVLWSQQSAASIDAIRDAFFMMERTPKRYAGLTGHIASVAHHYDLPHQALPYNLIDYYHLSPCGYVQLAQRIADGITTPSVLPKVQGSLVLEGRTRIMFRTSVPVIAFAPTSAWNQFFHVEVDGVLQSGFLVEANGLKIAIQLPPLPKPPQSVRVRYVAGSGYGATWTAGPIVTATGQPLEPFVLSN